MEHPVPSAPASGMYDVQATATDIAGNVGTDTTNNELLVDTVNPTVAVNALTTNNNEPTLKGTVGDAAPSSGVLGVQVLVGTQTLTATVTGTSWSVLVPEALNDGTYDVAVTATDKAGNVGSDTTTDELVVDTVKPTVTVHSLSTNDNTPTLTGTVIDPAPGSGPSGVVTVAVGGQSLGNASVTVNGTTWNWSIVVPSALNDGVYDVQATATDNAGNAGTDSTLNELTVDTVSPIVTVTNVFTNSSMPTLTGTAADPNGSGVSGNVTVTIVAGSADFTSSGGRSS